VHKLVLWAGFRRDSLARMEIASNFCSTFHSLSDQRMLIATTNCCICFWICCSNCESSKSRKIRITRFANGNANWNIF